jgi:hypothetical protein
MIALDADGKAGASQKYPSARASHPIALGVVHILFYAGTHQNQRKS